MTDNSNPVKNNYNFKKKIEETISADPFPLYIEDNFLDKEFYQKLKHDLSNILRTKTIYDEEKNVEVGRENENSYKTLGGGRNQSSNSKIKKIFQESKTWTNLLSYFDSVEFVETITDAIKKKISFKRKIIYRPPYYEQSILQKIFQINIYVTFKFSRYPSGSGMAPHRDFSDKFISGLFYLGFSDKGKREIGGTQFFKEVNNTPKIDHYTDDADQFLIWKDVFPIDNRFIFFLKTSKSWHKVKPFQLEKGVTRDNLQINLMHSHLGKFSSIINRTFKIMLSFISHLNDEIKSILFVLKEKQSIKYNSNVLIKNNKIIVKKIKNFNGVGSFWDLRYLYHFFKNSFLIFNRKRRTIRKVVLNHCKPVHKNIFLQSGYGVDISRIKPADNVFSFGIFEDINFEKFLNEELRLNIFSADPTPITQKFMKNKTKTNFLYEPKAIHVKTGKVKFYFGSSDQNEENMEGSINNINNQRNYTEVDSYTLDDFKNHWNCNKVHFLKMDIEGSAIDILRYIVSKKGDNLINQIACEIEFPNPKENKDFVHKINGVLNCLKVYYDIYYLPRYNRFTNLEILLVKK